MSATKHGLGGSIEMYAGCGPEENEANREQDQLVDARKNMVPCAICGGEGWFRLQSKGSDSIQTVQPMCYSKNGCGTIIKIWLPVPVAVNVWNAAMRAIKEALKEW